MAQDDLTYGGNMQSSITKRDFRTVKLTPELVQQVAAFEIGFYTLAAQIEAELPCSSHKSAALRQLLETKMTVMHAISRSDAHAEFANHLGENAPCNSDFEKDIKSQGA